MQFFGEVWTRHRCATTGARDGPDNAENRGVPHFQFLIVRGTSCGSEIGEKTVEFPQLQFLLCCGRPVLVRRRLGGALDDSQL